MNIVVDANVIIAALMGSRATLTIITSQNYNFYAPSRIVQEVGKYKNFICEKSFQESEDFDINLRALLFFIKEVDYWGYIMFMETAKKAIEERDMKDMDYIACALAVNASFIWTNDKDFTDRAIIPTKTTKRFIEDNK